MRGWDAGRRWPVSDFSQNSGSLVLNAHHAAFPSCDLLNAYDLKSSLASGEDNCGKCDL